MLDVRGAERVFEALSHLWPRADIYTAVYDENGTERRFAGRNVRASFLQLLRPSAQTFRGLLPLYPAAIESFDLSGYDLVVSSSSAWAHGVICMPPTVHICYCHNPFRYAWSDCESTLARRRDPISRAMLGDIFGRWRRWDQTAARRTSRYIANSHATQARIREFFGRDSAVVYPPVDVERFAPGPVADHYAIVSELVPHKRIAVAIEAFNELRRPLIVVGDGPDARGLRRIAGPTIQFTGRVSDATVGAILQAARALVVSGVEEFGIAAVEAQAAGRPVIARRGGGALETVIEGVTGCFWSGGARELSRAVVSFDDAAIDPQACVQSAARFGPSSFRAGIMREVAVACSSGSSTPEASPAAVPDPTLLRVPARGRME